MVIVIPTYNEKENIGPMITGIRGVVPNAQILFVDDASPDGTNQEIKLYQDKFPGILLLERAGKLGLGSAYLEAFRKILAENLDDVVVTMDADQSHPFETLKIFDAETQAHDLIIGSRYTKGGQTKNWTWGRRIISRLGNWYERTLNGLPVRDVTSGFMAIRTELLQKIDLDLIRSRGYSFLTEFKKMLLAQTNSYKEIPITFTERKIGQSKFSIAIMIEAMFLPLRLNPKIRYAVFVFLLSLAAYIGTAPRTIFLNDNAEFITAGKVLGVPHPTGYPLYVMISKLFSYLPIGSIAFRINFLSMVCASASLVVIFLWLCKILETYVAIDKKVWVWMISAATSLSIGSSLLFWSQAVTAKTYTLHFLLLSLILYCLWQFWQTGKSKYFYWICFLAALGVANHSMMSLFAPAIFVGLLLGIKKTTWKTWVIGLLLGISGLLPYAYLPLRSSEYPAPYSWGVPINTIQRFKHFILPTDYYHFGINVSFPDQQKFIVDFGYQLYHELGALLILSIVGIIFLTFRNKKLLAVILLSIFGNVLGILVLRRVEYNFANSYYYSFYYLSAIALSFVLCGFGLFALYQMLAPKLGARIYLFSLILLAVPIIVFSINYNLNNLRNFTYDDAYTKALIESLEPNSVLLVASNGPDEDTLVFGLVYQKVVNKLRPDVSILGLPGIYSEGNLEKLREIFGENNIQTLRDKLVVYAESDPQFRDRPMYTNFLAIAPLINQKSYSNGLAYKLSDAPKSPFTEPNTVQISASDNNLLTHDLAGSDFLAQYYYSQAAYLLDHGQRKEAGANYIAGIRLDYDINGPDQLNYMQYRNSIK